MQRLLNVDFYRCSIKSNGSPPMDPRRNSGTLPNSINCKFVLPQDSSFKHELAEPTAVNLNFPAFKIAAQTRKIFQCYSVIILRKFLKNFHFNFFFLILILFLLFEKVFQVFCKFPIEIFSNFSLPSFLFFKFLLNLQYFNQIFSAFNEYIEWRNWIIEFSDEFNRFLSFSYCFSFFFDFSICNLFSIFLKICLSEIFLWLILMLNFFFFCEWLAFRFDFLLWLLCKR